VIEVPALRDRREEILPLAETFVSRFRAAVGRPRLTLSGDARQLLQAWHWPGNVRELANVLYRAARATARDEIGRDALPTRLSVDSESDNFRGAMRAAERELLLDTLSRTRWNVTAAATRLGIPRRTIVHRMAKLGLKRPAR
jgi:DNA-binding NtrC family response regulator